MLLLSKVQYNQTFSTMPTGNSHHFYPRPRYSREHCTRSRNYREFHIFFNPIPAGFPRETRGFGPIPTPMQNSSHNPHVWQTDARMDGQTPLLQLVHAGIPCSAVKTVFRTVLLIRKASQHFWLGWFIATLHPRYNASQYNADSVITRLRSWTPIFQVDLVSGYWTWR